MNSVHSAVFFKRQEEEKIRLSRMDSNMAISNQDVAGVAKYWMEDIIVISGEGGQYCGKAKLLKTWKEMFHQKSPLFERLPSAIEIGDSGILAWETGTWNYKNAPYRGNYSAMWRKIDGIWLTQSELFVSMD